MTPEQAALAVLTRWFAESSEYWFLSDRSPYADPRPFLTLDGTITLSVDEYEALCQLGDPGD